VTGPLRALGALSRCSSSLRSLLQAAWIHFKRLLSALDHLMAKLDAPLALRLRAIGGR
jgi:hypothetical protein